MNILLKTLSVVAALLFIARAVAELFVIDVTDASTYANEWGGPSLAGVLAVHCGPGVLAAMFLYGSVVRLRSSRKPEVVSSDR